MSKLTAIQIAGILLICTATAQADHDGFNDLRRRSGRPDVILVPGPRRGGPRLEDPGRQAAVRACMNATWDNEKSACIQAANAAEYFDPAAAQACGGMTWGQNITGCLNAIANKTYMPEEVQLCADSTWDEQKIGCFANGGRRFMRGRPRWERRPSLDFFILEKLRVIRADLERGDVRRGLFGLVELINIVEEGSRP